MTAGWAHRMHETTWERMFGLHEIFKCAYLKFTVYGRKHTHNFRKCSHASVGLVQARPNEGCTLKPHLHVI